MSYKDDGVTLDYDRLKTYSYSSEDKATTQDTSIHTSPHSLSKGSISHSIHTPFSKGVEASRENNSVSQSKHGNNKPIVVLDDEPIFYNLERERSGDIIETKQEPRRSATMTSESSRQKKRDDRTKKQEIAAGKQGKKMRDETLKRNQSLYTVIDDDLTIFETIPMKKVKSEIRPEVDERSKDNSRRKKKKKEEVKGNGIHIEEQVTTKPNFLSNRIPDFFGKFQTDNMYIINKAFYFDPVKVAL
jgi:hypothetical protein